MISNYSLPPDMLNQYVKIYHEAAKTHLDERGEPIVTWLAEFLDKAGETSDSSTRINH